VTTPAPPISMPTPTVPSTTTSGSLAAPIPLRWTAAAAVPSPSLAPAWASPLRSTHHSHDHSRAKGKENTPGSARAVAAVTTTKSGRASVTAAAAAATSASSLSPGPPPGGVLRASMRNIDQLVYALETANDLHDARRPNLPFPARASPRAIASPQSGRARPSSSSSSSPSAATTTATATATAAPASTDLARHHSPVRWGSRSPARGRPSVVTVGGTAAVGRSQLTPSFLPMTTTVPFHSSQPHREPSYSPSRSRSSQDGRVSLLSIGRSASASSLSSVGSTGSRSGSARAQRAGCVPRARPFVPGGAAPPGPVGPVLFPIRGMHTVC
jgi:hypothetical protein